jgi:outer membrane autotransporter protein
LTGGNLANALSLLSGEAATGAQRSAFDVTGQFLGLMLDPFVDGRRAIAGTGGPALGFAPEANALPSEIARGYSDLKSPITKAPIPERRLTAWGAGFGGWNKTSGDPVVGSHDLTARNAGIAAGLDYRATPDTVVGFAFAGAAADWTLAQGLGGGKNNAFQAGAYAATRWGPAYLAASIAFANHWMSTDRNAAFGDQLTARFTGQSLGGRLEQGWRFGTPTMGLTPYGGVQAQAFRTPGYSETGGGFALAYDPRNATALRGEIGERFDYTALMSPDATLTLRARLAWAHDWVSDHSITAAFQTLPGAIFTVNGAAPATDSGLVSAGAELRLANGVTLLGKVDGELARHSTTYAGTGTLRVSW